MSKKSNIGTEILAKKAQKLDKQKTAPAIELKAQLLGFVKFAESSQPNNAKYVREAEAKRDLPLQDDTINIRDELIARWSAMEQALANERFWGFLGQSKCEFSARMDLLFALAFQISTKSAQVDSKAVDSVMIDFQMADSQKSSLRFDFMAFKRADFTLMCINPAPNELQKYAKLFSQAKEGFCMDDEMKRFLAVLFRHRSEFFSKEDFKYFMDTRIYYEDEERTKPTRSSHAIFHKLGAIISAYLQKVADKWESSEKIGNLCLVSQAQKDECANQPLSIKACEIFDGFINGTPFMPSTLEVAKNGLKNTYWSEESAREYTYKISYELEYLSGFAWAQRRVHNRSKNLEYHQRLYCRWFDE